MTPPPPDPAATPGSGPSPPAAWNVALSDASHTVSVAVAADDLVVTVDGIASSRPVSSVTSLSVAGGAGDDSFDVSAGALPVPVALDGGAGNDTLHGPAADSTWTISGQGSGSVAGISFAGFENLAGAAGNKDTFVVDAGGGVSGVVDGGAGGYDSLVLAGHPDTVVSTPTGPHSGILRRGRREGHVRRPRADRRLGREHHHHRGRGRQSEPGPAGRHVQGLAVHERRLGDRRLPDRRELHPGAELRRPDRVDLRRRAQLLRDLGNELAHDQRRARHRPHRVHRRLPRPELDAHGQHGDDQARLRRHRRRRHRERQLQRRVDGRRHRRAGDRHHAAGRHREHRARQRHSQRRHRRPRGVFDEREDDRQRCEPDLSAGTLVVATTTPFLSSGKFTIAGITGTCSYTGTTDRTKFTGITGCTGHAGRRRRDRLRGNPRERQRHRDQPRGAPADLQRHDQHPRNLDDHGHRAT